MNGHSNGTVSEQTINGQARNVEVEAPVTNGSNSTALNGSSHPPTNGNGYHSPTSFPSSPEQEPLAICGMAIRAPGRIYSPKDLWELIVSKGDARGPIPKSRYNVDAYISDTNNPGTVISRHGYFLDEELDLGTLDASFFSMPRAELERVDPHQRQMLEVVRECFEDAGEVAWKGKSIGVYMGSFGEDWCEMFSKETQQYGLYRVNGYGDFMLSNRVSYEMDLKGPSMTIRTGCSAALVALHEACLAVSNGQCKSAIVGGANLIMAPGMTTSMTEQGVLSADGSCKTFSAEANGYARGEAINAVFIKPLSAAVADGNPVRAVIRATATNSDGKTPGISCPSTEAHEALIRQAYRNAGIDNYSETGFVECHGTGTPVGDPIEANAVGRVFHKSGVYIGSIKPNMGHSEGASGLTSLIKMVLALETRTIPPNIKFSTPNPNINFESCGLKVATEPLPWPKDRQERASINSFGIGGTNAHVIIDSAESFRGPSASIQTPRQPPMPKLLLHSANTNESLQKQVDNYDTYLAQHPESVQDLSFTLANRRQHLPYRTWLVSDGVQQLASSTISKIGQRPEIVMVFTGQGAQWPGMGRELMQDSPVFRNSILKMDGLLKAGPNPPKWTLEDILMDTASGFDLHKAELSQPVCTAVQVALVDHLASVSIHPAAVVGHSSGEIAAAYAAGALSMQEAIIVASHRGMVTKKQTKTGGMAAIGLGWDTVKPLLQEGTVVACENSPSNVTISGGLQSLESTVEFIKKANPQAMARVLKVDQAYHSHYMSEIGEHYHVLIQDEVKGQSPTARFFSSVYGRELAADESLGSRYWVKNLESPVLFRTAVASILQDKVGTNAVFIEVGPHSALAGPLRQTFSQARISPPYVPVMIRGKDCLVSMYSAIGQLHQLDVAIDFKAVVPNGFTLPDLPRYAWDHQHSFWYESRLSKEWRHRQFAAHPLLGVRVPESTDAEPSWRNLLHLDSVPWVRDHRIRSSIVFPFAAYVAMAGKAVEQLSGISTGFKLRHVLVNTALLVTEGSPVEMITSFRQHRLTDSLHSSWWEFSISSYSHDAWVNHCSGQIMAEEVKPEKRDRPVAQPRAVMPRDWYRRLKDIGLEYGPYFQGLTTLSAATCEQIAAGSVAANVLADVADYHVHPTVVDNFLQLLSVAFAQGTPRKLHSLVVPTLIEDLRVYGSAAACDMTVNAYSGSKKSVCGNGQCVDGDGNVVISMSGIRLSVLEDDNHDESEVQSTARLEWKPDIDSLDVGELLRSSVDREAYIPMLDELTRFCIAKSLRDLDQLETKMPHMGKFKQWLQRQRQGDIQNTGALATLDVAALEQKILSLNDKLAQTPAAIAATAMQKVLNSLKQIYLGEEQPLEVLLADKVLAELYDFTDQCDRTKFLEALCHKRPNLRILEIGAGTGATTNNILRSLVRPNGSPLYSRYTFTDISSGFFVAAKDRFKHVANMDFQPLDISRDPLDQGFTQGSYDLIVATNVLHATETLQTTLENVKCLLAPEGRMLLQEISSTSKWINFIFGVLPGWWLGEADGRIDEPYITPARWREHLKASGYDNFEAVVLDDKEPYQLNAIMVAKPSPPLARPKAITLLRDGDSAAVKEIANALKSKGFQLSECSLGDAPPSNQDIVSILDVDEPFFANMGQEKYESFKTFIQQCQNSGMLWVTHASQMRSKDPRYAQTIGVARTLRTELSMDFATIEMDNMSSTDQLAQVLASFHARSDDGLLKPEFEYMVQKGEIQVGRYHPFALQKELASSKGSEKLVMDIEKLGRLSSISWTPREVPDLGPEEVEVENYAVGVNFRDILSTLGIVDIPKAGLGLEAAGVVRRIGSGVENIAVGDRVILFGGGAFSSLVKTSAVLCSKMPPQLSFEDASTMPCVYGTVIHCLEDVGRLEKDQSILIHSACGGVGISAIQIARHLGAKIYATVGTEEKVQYLMDTFGLERSCIFNSRDAYFLPDIMRETDGKGVDLVLNSLSGELLHASWRCVAEFGKMIEIGKTDLLGSGKLDMDVFLANRSYCCVDLDEICSKKPMICGRLLDRVIEYYEAGIIEPIRPTKAFDAGAIEEAFRYMQKGSRIGKVVLSIRDAAGKLLLEPSASSKPAPPSFDPSAAYLLIGGLGGLGRAISSWMVEHGARHLVYLSRSAGQRSTDVDFARELQSQGCEAQLIQGNVAKPEDVERAMKMISKPLHGILQMSMVLRDEAFARMSFEDWNSAVAPKIQGTWNLHNATTSAACELDFFVLFSSMSGTIGQPGQANYASANTFLDAFTAYRNDLNMVASTVDIGAVQDVGYIAHNEDLLRKMEASAAYAVREQELLDGLSLAVRARPVQQGNAAGPFVTQNNFVLGLWSDVPLNSDQSRATWKKDRRMGVYHNFSSANKESAAEASSDTLNAVLNSVRNDAAALQTEATSITLATEIGKKVMSFLLKSPEDVDLKRSLTEMGLDSLVAIELRSWWKVVFGFDVSVLEIMNQGSLQALGEHAAQGLLQQLEGQGS